MNQILPTEQSPLDYMLDKLFIYFFLSTCVQVVAWVLGSIVPALLGFLSR
jgi:hypothetical protein